MNSVFRTFGQRTALAVAALVVALGIAHSQPVSAQTVDETWKFIQEMTVGKATMEEVVSGYSIEIAVSEIIYSKVDHQVSFSHGSNDTLTFVLDDIHIMGLAPHSTRTGLIGVTFQCKSGALCISLRSTQSGQTFRQFNVEGIRFTGSSAAERVLKAFQHLHKLALSEEKKTPF